jgi:hypothetical protein
LAFPPWTFPGFYAVTGAPSSPPWNSFALRGLFRVNGVSEFLMVRRKAKSESVLDTFWAFVRDNPKLATTLAFELGSLAGTAIKNSSQAKKVLKRGAKKMPQAVASAMSPALKYLPAPKSQPRKKHAATRKTRHASE